MQQNKSIFQLPAKLVNLTGWNILAWNHSKSEKIFLESCEKPIKLSKRCEVGYFSAEKEVFTIFDFKKELLLENYFEELFDNAGSYFIVQNDVREIAGREDFISPYKFNLNSETGVYEVFNFIK